MLWIILCLFFVLNEAGGYIRTNTGLVIPHDDFIRIVRDYGTFPPFTHGLHLFYKVKSSFWANTMIEASIGITEVEAGEIISQLKV